MYIIMGKFQELMENNKENKEQNLHVHENFYIYKNVYIS